MVNIMNWRKSSYSGDNSGNCVEVSDGPDVIAVRDTADRKGPELKFSPDAWRSLVKHVKQS